MGANDLMTDLWERNLSALANIDRHLASRLHEQSSADLLSNRSDDLATEETTGNPIFKNISINPAGFNSTQFYDLDKPLVVIGFDDPRSIKKNLAKRKWPVVIYEPFFAILHYQLSRIDLSDLLLRKKLWIADNWQSLFIVFDRAVDPQVGYHPVVLPGHLELIGNSEKNRLLSDLQQWTRRRHWIKAQTRRQSADWSLSTLKNLSWIVKRPGINHLDKQFPDVPVLLISPGPSLTDSIDHLRQWVGKALFVTVSRAVPVLLNAQLIPDVVVVAESEASQRALLQPLLDFEKFSHVRFVLEARTHPEIFNLFGNRAFIYCSTGNQAALWICQKIGNRGLDVAGPSVSCLAAVVALRLGCNPIILVGQDIAYAEDGQFYAPDAVGHEEDEPIVTSMANDRFHTRVQNRDGKWLDTGFQYATLIPWFRKFADSTRQGKTRLVNATPNGVPLEGWSFVDLGDLAADFPKLKHDLTSAFELTPESTTPPTALLNDLHEANRELGRVRKIAKQSLLNQAQSAEDAVSACQQQRLAMSLIALLIEEDLYNIRQCLATAPSTTAAERADQLLLAAIAEKSQSLIPIIEHHLGTLIEQYRR